jgi:hypothetical protein
VTVERIFVMWAMTEDRGVVSLMGVKGDSIFDGQAWGADGDCVLLDLGGTMGRGTEKAVRWK